MPTLASSIKPSSSTKPETIYVTSTKVVSTDLGIVTGLVFGLMAGFLILAGLIFYVLKRFRQKKFERIAKDIMNPVHDDTPL